jgi:hypothetical protein
MADQPASKRPERPERRDRRAPAGPPGSIRWMKSILGRPLSLQRRDGGLHMTLVERRRSPDVIQAESMERLREELRLRLLEIEHRHATSVMRHLVLVHDVLGRQGWAGVQAMNSALLRKAIAQVQMLVDHEPSARLRRLVVKLRMMQVAAEVREERMQVHAQALADGAPLEVSEISVEEFESSQREWDATMPAPLDPLDPLDA